MLLTAESAAEVPQEAELPRRWMAPNVALGLALLCGAAVAAAVWRPRASADNQRSSGFLRRLQPAGPQVYCTEDFRGYFNSSGPGQPVRTQCAEEQRCVCSYVEESEEQDRWHCRGETVDAPCASAPDPPTSYPREVFFASFQADMTSLYSGTSAIWNSSGWWVFDSKSNRQRLDVTTHVRSLSSGSHLNTFRHSTITLHDSAAELAGSARTVSHYDASAQDLFKSGKAPTCARSVLRQFPEEPLHGDALRFVPVEFQASASGWTSHEDRYLGKTCDKDGRCAAEWGWTQMRGAFQVGRHRVWLDFDGTPIREEQWYSLGGQGTHATVNFRSPENAYGSFGALQANTDELFRLPGSCQ
mmetsp:Transcript_8417/g.22552  ORF Transcript_8417/g.22552 Transcript_8417/m.22552 type:complete len:358 (+) Transcript_8417:55-1128(+)